MFLTLQLSNLLSEILSLKTGKSGELSVLEQVSGGSINTCYRIRFDGTDYFLKLNCATKFPEMFAAEAEGLRRIGGTGAIRVPEVVATGCFDEEQYLILSWVDSGAKSRRTEELLGRQLAALHSVSSPSFGFDHNNYMGSLVQYNSLSSSFKDFFLTQRLEPQLKLARANGLESSLFKKFDVLATRLNDLTPEERPSLVHGDLWAGNFMIDAGGCPVLVDPAIAFSNREIDLAMTRLFGGFGYAFYQAYEESFPREPGWKERLDLWNLYPLLVHVNLFGTSYVPQLLRCLNRYI